MAKLMKLMKTASVVSRCPLACCHTDLDRSRCYGTAAASIRARYFLREIPRLRTKVRDRSIAMFLYLSFTSSDVEYCSQYTTSEVAFQGLGRLLITANVLLLSKPFELRCSSCS